MVESWIIVVSGQSTEPSLRFKVQILDMGDILSSPEWLLLENCGDEQSSQQMYRLVGFKAILNELLPLDFTALWDAREEYAKTASSSMGVS